MSDKTKIILCSFSLIILLIPIFVYWPKNKENNSILKDKNNEIEYITQFAIDNNVELDAIKEYSLNEKYINYYIYSEKINSVIIDKSTKKEVDIFTILENNQEESFKKIIEEQLKIKYPKFIVDELKKTETEKEYIFSEEGLKIYFYNYVTNPLYEKDTDIELTCSMLKKIISFNCNNDNKDNPNETVKNNQEKYVVLTFDDGPNNNTERILNVLEENKATATFFMLGINMNYYPKIVEKVAISANEIASHTYSHKNLLKLSEDDLNYEINKPYEILSNITDKKINLVRPPYGLINANVNSIINKPIIMWSIDPEDWRYRDKNIITKNVLDKIEEGDIILLHDIHSTTADALEILLPELYIRDFRVVSVNNLLSKKNINLENQKIYRTIK